MMLAQRPASVKRQLLRALTAVSRKQLETESRRVDAQSYGDLSVSSTLSTSYQVSLCSVYVYIVPQKIIDCYRVSRL